MPITTPPTAPSRADPTTFPARADAWVAWQESSLVPQINALEANVNAKEASTVAAAATAQAAITSINTALNRYTFSTSTTMSDPGVGIVRFNNATLASVTAIAMDAQSADAGNPNIIGLLANFGASDSAIKGLIRFTQAGTPSTFAAFNITAVVNNTGWAQLTVTHVASAGSFTNGTSFVMEFHRTGDAGDAQALRDDLASSAAGNGAALVGFDFATIPAAIKKADWAIQTASTGVSVLRYIPPSEWVGIFSGASTYDVTTAIQTAINAHSDVYLPEGVFNVDAVTGLVVRTGTRLVGAGKNKSIIVAKPGGGTLVELANYNRGSVIRRQFNKSPGTNAYVNEVYLADFSVVLTHPTGSVTTTQIQIGIDLRNITRSIVERVHVGNIAPLSGSYSKAANGAYDVQGYGIVVGNVSSIESSYAGGEVNTIRDCSVWGAYKLIVQDDGVLSPLSSAHATTVQNCDLQVGHHVLVQESQYSTGNAWRDNVLQSAIKQPGDVSNAFIVRCDGYNNEMSGGYIEAGSAANYLLYLGASSKNNHFRLSYYSATNAALITDAGTKNEVEYFENAGTVAGGVDPFGAPVRLYDRAYRRAWVKFHWDGSAIVIDGGQGIQSVTRVAVGDYTITFAKAFSSDNYGLSIAMDTNASGHGGMFSVGAHSSSSLRIYTYAQNGSVSTQIDPRFVWVQVGQ